MNFFILQMNTVPFMSYNAAFYPVSSNYFPASHVDIDAPIDLSVKKTCTPFAFPPTQLPYIEPSESSVCLSPKSVSDSDGSEYSESSTGVSSVDVKLGGPKAVRPFKAFPKDPLSLSLGTSLPTLCDYNSDEAYEEFREKMLARVRTNTGTNKNMRRNSQSQTAQSEDPNYREKRRKNNEAAKRSRDARKAKEDEIAVRCAFLEQENIKLKMQISSVEQENARMRMMCSVNK